MPHRWISILGALALLAAAAPAGATDMSVSPDRQAIEQIIHDYLMAHPEVVIESLRAGDARAKEQAAADTRAQIAKHRNELVHDAKSPEAGNPAGDVTIVEFFDYRCPYCKSVAAAFMDLYEKDGNVRFVLKEFPILGADSEFASKAALAAQKQGKYRDFHLAMMNFKGKMTSDDVRQLAANVGIDVARLEKDMQDPAIVETINRNYALADALGIRGTPAFIIGDQLIPGAISAEDLQKHIAAVRNTQG